MPKATELRGVVGEGCPLLTPRQRQAIECMADGLSTHGIAFRLGLTPRTVKVYVSQIYTRLSDRGVRSQSGGRIESREALVAWWMREEAPRG